MKKQIAIGAIALIIIITIVIYAAVFDKKFTKQATQPQQSEASKSVMEKPVTASNAAGNIDAEVSALEKDINSITEEDFSESALSDSELGL